MPQFFSDAPVDFGARYIAQGYSGVADSLNGIQKQIYNSYDQKNRLEQQDSIQRGQMGLEAKLREQAQRTEAERQLTQSLGQYGVSPIYDSSGQLNVAASAASLLKAKDMHDRLEQQTKASDAYNFDLGNDARKYGVGGGTLPSPDAVKSAFNSGQDVTKLAPAPFQGSSGNLARDVEDAKNKQRLDDYAQQRSVINTSAAATRRETELQQFRQATGRDPFASEVNGKGELNAAGLNAGKTAGETMKLTASQRNAQAAVDAAIQSGSLDPADRDAAIEVYQQSGGRAPQMPQSQRDSVASNLGTLNGVRALRSTVGKEDKGDFGPLSFRAKTAAGKLLGAYPEARATDQAFTEALAGRGFAQGGKALTETELGMIRPQLGSPNDSDFPDRLAQYEARTVRDAQLQLDNIQSSPLRFTPDGRAAIAQLKKAISGMQDQPATDSTANASPMAPAAPQALKINSITRVK